MSHKSKTKIIGDKVMIRNIQSKMTGNKIMIRKLQSKQKESLKPKKRSKGYHGQHGTKSPIPPEVLLKMKGDTNTHEKDSKLILKQTSKEHKS